MKQLLTAIGFLAASVGIAGAQIPNDGMTDATNAINAAWGEKVRSAHD